MNDEIVINNIKCHKIKNENSKHGGNGEVYFYIDDNGKKYAVKEFKKSKWKNNERFLRFKREIEFLKTDGMNIDGVIPLIDSHIVDNYDDLSKENELYYVMPKAEPFIISKMYNLGIASILCVFKSLAMTLKTLHNKGIAHRDIKPENILILDDKYYFSDFGLLWNESLERLTINPERVGPYKILPPELELVNSNIDIDFRKSDVYLLAKVLWMCLKGNNNGFYGRYNRSDSQIYLGFYESGKVLTFEPINILLESATNKKWEDRISIDKFIELLNKQINILKNNVKQPEIDALANQEKFKKLYVETSPSAIVSYNIEQIYKFINEMKFSNDFIIINKQSDKRIFIKIKKIDKDNVNKAININCNIYNQNINLHFIPKSIELMKNSNKAIICISNNDFSSYPLFNFNINGIENESYLDDNFEIRYEDKNYFDL